MEMVDATGEQDLLSMAQRIDAMEIAMQAIPDHTLSIPPRVIMPLIDGSAYFAEKPGSIARPRV